MASPLDERIARNLTDLIQIFRIERGRSDAIKPHPMDPHYCALGLLLHGDMSISEIGMKLQRSKPNMSAIISRLLKEGRIRKVADEKDKRIMRISITGKGRMMMDQRMKRVREHIKDNLSVLDKEEKERLCSSLQIVNQMARKVGRHD
jgi:DNA-binding MarR family transcriptional regulator